MICRHKLYHFTVANTRFTAPLTRRGKTKFATIKWYNLCLQIIQSQTCYPLIHNNISVSLKCNYESWLYKYYHALLRMLAQNYFTDDPVTQEPQCAMFSRMFTCPSIFLNPQNTMHFTRFSLFKLYVALRRWLNRVKCIVLYGFKQ